MSVSVSQANNSVLVVVCNSIWRFILLEKRIMQRFAGQKHTQFVIAKHVVTSLSKTHTHTHTQAQWHFFSQISALNSHWQLSSFLQVSWSSAINGGQRSMSCREAWPLCLTVCLFAVAVVWWSIMMLGDNNGLGTWTKRCSLQLAPNWNCCKLQAKVNGPGKLISSCQQPRTTISENPIQLYWHNAPIMADRWAKKRLSWTCPKSMEAYCG